MSATTGAWFIQLEGYGSVWRALKVHNDKRKAVDAIALDFPITEDEGRRIRAFLEEEVKVGDGLLLVGHFDPKGQRVLDRRIVRVEGP